MNKTALDAMLDSHPCYNEGAHRRYARMHLPVAPKCNIQCNYCNRRYDCCNESRPGVTSEVLSAPATNGDVVVVQGAGTIGILAAQVAKAAGAGRVIITDVASAREVKLPVARALPAIDQVVDITETDLKALVMAETDGRGADMVVDCSGSEAAVKSAFGLVRRSGRVVAIGEPATPSISVNWIDAIIQNIDLHFTFGSTNDAWRIALQLVADGRVQLKPLISHRIALADFEEGFKLMDDKKALKVMMFPHGEAAAR